jgi:aryl-alcohol dehydrogenase-like predicted oxidoreductase
MGICVPVTEIRTLARMDRRNFLQSALASTVIAKTAGGAKTPLARRHYKDKIDLSIIGLGGVVVCGMEQKAADAIVADSFERGVNYYDVAPSYFDGEAETKLGHALQPFRDKIFLACKTQKRDAKGAVEELEQSLKRIGTDRFDLYQFHAVTKLDEVEKIVGPGGAAETFLRARKDGKVRYLGCTAHSEEAALALLERFPLDSIVFPINFISVSQADFGPRVIARAREKGVARMAIKALARTAWSEHDPHRREHPKTWYAPIDEPELVDKALRFTLSEDITAAIPPGDEKIYAMALEAAARFQPLTADERHALLASTKSMTPLFPRP